jgi:hypothetical protein
MRGDPPLRIVSQLENRYESPRELRRLKALEREVKEPRQANEILRLAGASFAQAGLDCLKKK